MLSSPGRNVYKWPFQISLMPSVPGNLSAWCSPPSPWVRGGMSSAEGVQAGMGVFHVDASGLGRQKLARLWVRSRPWFELPDFASFSFERHHPPCQEQLCRPGRPCPPHAKLPHKPNANTSQDGAGGFFSKITALYKALTYIKPREA